MVAAKRGARPCAGHETTRNALTRRALALLERPDQVDKFERAPALLTDSLVEEVVRFTSPVIQFAADPSRRIRLCGRLILRTT